MREIRTSGSEGGEAGTNRPSLPLSLSGVPAMAHPPAGVIDTATGVDFQWGQQAAG